MMETDPRDAVAAALCRVIQKQAFMFGEAADKFELPQVSTEYLLARMQFGGPMQGVLSLVVPVDMSLEIAANVLGEDKSQPPGLDSGVDALKEVLNVTCGHVLTALAGMEPVFDFFVPQSAEIDAEGWAKFREHRDTMGLLVGGYPVLLRLSLADRGAGESGS